MSVHSAPTARRFQSFVYELGKAAHSTYTIVCLFVFTAILTRVHAHGLELCNDVIKELKIKKDKFAVTNEKDRSSVSR